MDTKELLKMEADVLAAREKLKTELLGKVEVILVELRAIKFQYELVENGKKKIGRPRKGGDGEATQIRKAS